MFEDHFGDLVSQWSQEASDPMVLEDQMQAREVRRWVESKLLPIPEPQTKIDKRWGDRRTAARRWSVLAQRYGLDDAACDDTLRAIAARNGIQSERTRQVIQKVIRWLRGHARADDIHGGG